MKRWAVGWCLALLVGVVAAGPSHEQLADLERAARAAPEATAHKIEALLARESGDIVLRVRALALLGNLRAVMGDPDAAEREAGRLEALAVGRNTALAQAAAAAVRARLLQQTGPLARADRLASEALHLLPDDAPVGLRVRYLALHAAIRDSAGRFDDAVRLQLQAIALAEPAAPAWMKSELSSGLAYTLHQAGQHERARSFNHEAIAFATLADDGVAMSAAMTIEAILLSDGGDPVAELAALTAAIDHARNAGARRDEVLALANLADFYLRRGQYAVALARAQDALPLAQELNNASAESLALINSGLAMIGLKRKAAGVALVRQGIAMDARTGAIAPMAQTWHELGMYLERAGYLADALEAYREHRKLADEVFLRDQQKAILELQENFHHERRLREIELLNRDNALKDVQLRTRALQQRLWAAAAAAGLLAIALIALLHRRVRERNVHLATHNDELRQHSECDPLTGLSNRRRFHEQMRQRCPEGRLEGSLFLLDIDHFKRVNDEHGHAAGDQVLVEVARRLTATLRDDDLVVRWGGEEFLVLARALSPDQVEALASRLLEVIGATPVLAADGPIAITASIGFASFPLPPTQRELPWERAVALVDTAMYLAKAHGRNRAYGVRLLEAADGAQFDTIANNLEAAWRDGQVTLTQRAGPQEPVA